MSQMCRFARRPARHGAIFGSWANHGVKTMERHIEDRGLFGLRRVTQGDIRIAMLVTIAGMVVLNLAA